MRPSRSFLVVAALGAALLCGPTAARAQLTMVEPGFRDSTLSLDFAKQVELGIGPDTCLYYGSNAGLKKRCAPFDPGVICDASLQFPVGIAFSTGGSFGNFMYVADYSINDIHRASGCAATTLFAALPGPGALAFPPSGSPYGDFLYACVAFDGPIYRVSSTGVLTIWSTLDTAYLRFGPGGAWGTGLYATRYTFPDSVGIVKVSTNGSFTPLIGDMLTPEGFDWGFNGDLFATDAALGEIYRVKSNGSKTVFATLPGAADVAYRPGEKALYVVSNQGGLYRITAQGTVGVSEEGPLAGRLTAFPNPARSGCALRFTTTLAGVARVRVVDVTGRLVRNLSAAWRPAGEQSISWDGRNETGALARPGTYFANVIVAGTTRVARVTITR